MNPGFFGLLMPYGIFAFLVGLLLFFFTPTVPRILNIFHRLSHLHIYLGARMLKRASIIISEQGDLLLKRMSPTDIGTEKITFSEMEKEFADPLHAKSSWAGIPFAFGDEVHGFFFSLKDAAVGRREKEARDKDEVVIKATAQEKEMYEVAGWQKAVYELPKKTFELVNLNDIRYLITGEERGEYPQTVETFYKNSREPYKDGRSTAQILMLIVALLGPFLMMFLLWQQVTQRGGGGTSVLEGMLILSLPSTGLFSKLHDRLKNVDWQTVKAKIIFALKAGLVILPLPSVFVAIGHFASPDTAMILLIYLGIGFFFVPLLVELLKASDALTSTLSEKLIKMGLIAYRNPVFVETSKGYEIREYSRLDVDENQVVRHTLLGRQFGFTFEPDPELWGTEVADKKKIESTAVTDGGAKTNIPSGYKIIPEKQRAVYGSMVPSKVKHGAYYLWSGVFLQKFRHVATGNKTRKRLEKAKEEYGEEESQQRGLIMMVSILGIISLLAGIIVFFVLVGV